MKIYPLTFYPILKQVIWGGKAIGAFKGIPLEVGNVGESWEVSTLPDSLSVVSNGELAGQLLKALVEKAPVEVLGQTVLNRFGPHFPLLVKFIDAAADLSVQVHPNDALAWERHQSAGKTEMWYVIDAQPDSKLVSGFSIPIDEAEYERRIVEGSIEEVLNYLSVKPGDVLYLPAGKVHAIGRGIFVAEIQQSSDITYRIYDYNRLDAAGLPRALHTEAAKTAIDYTFQPNGTVDYDHVDNQVVFLLKCPYFCVNRIRLNPTTAMKGALTPDAGAVLSAAGMVELHRSYQTIDSFVLLICMEGEGTIHYQGDQLTLRRGETVLLPAVLKDIVVRTSTSCLLLESYVESYSSSGV